MIDALFFLEVAGTTITAPPDGSDIGDRYIVSGGATGAWAGWDTAIAVCGGNTWRCYQPRKGWRAINTADGLTYRFDGTQWLAVSLSSDTGPGPSPNPSTTARVTYSQGVASKEWIVNHNLNCYPTVIVVDSAGNEITGAIFYPTLNRVIITFSAMFSGQASLF